MASLVPQRYRARERKTWPKLKTKIVEKGGGAHFEYYHNTRWALAANLVSEIDRVQRKMMATMSNIRKTPAETPEGFVRRHAREVGKTAGEHGPWNIRTAERVSMWHAHLLRPATAKSWAAMIGCRLAAQRENRPAYRRGERAPI